MSLKKFGRYEIVAELGRGSMGVVYKAFDPLLKRHIAIKSMGAAARLDSEFVKRFFREAEATAGLNHPNIVALYDIGEADSQPYIAIEFLEGDDLESILEKGVFIPFDRKLEIMIQVCEGLMHAHSRNVVHRDIKPSNIQLTPRGDVKIVDFGIAKLLSSNVTTTGQLMGTPSYMAPEQIAGDNVDHRSDVFGAGVMLYELITGEKPFAGEDFRTVMFSIVSQPHRPVTDVLPACAPELIAVVDRALAKDTGERFQTARELRDALQEIRPRLLLFAQKLREEVDQLREQLRAKRSDFSSHPEVMVLLEELLAVHPARDSDETLFGNRTEKEQDYGYLLHCQAEFPKKLERLSQLAQEQGQLQELAEECSRALEHENWEDGITAVDAILERIPESKTAQERKRLCQEKIEAAKAVPKEDASPEVAPGEPALAVSEEPAPPGPAVGPPIPPSSVQDVQAPVEVEPGLEAPPETRRSGWLIPVALLLLVAALSVWWFWSGETRPVAIYQVRAGDTVEELASRFQIGADELARNNRLDASAALIPGQVLELGGLPSNSGTLVLDLAPWANVESVVWTSDGRNVLRDTAVTPLTLRLAAGSYQIKAINPELGSNLEFTVEIEAGGLLREERPMPGFDVNSELDSLFGRSRE